MKIKTKKDWQNEIAARVAAAEAVGEQKLAEAREAHRADLEGANALAEQAARDAEAAAEMARGLSNVALVGIHLLDVSEQEILRLRDRVGTIENVAANQRNRVGALTATLSALRYAEQTPQIARVLDAVDGFVDLIRDDAERLIEEAKLASVEPDYDLPEITILPSLADDVEEPTAEHDLSGFARAAEKVGETDAERAFFNE